VVATKQDGGVVVAAQQVLKIESTPPGATILIDGKAVGKTPLDVPVEAHAKIHARLELKGYNPSEVDFDVKPGQTEHWTPVMSVAPATLHVDIDPPGAQVTVDGIKLGDAPFDKPLPAKPGAEVVISKSGFDTVKQTIDLVAGDTAAIKLTLKASQRFGLVRFQVGAGKQSDGFATITFNGASHENKDASGLTPFRLPVGRQRVHVHYSSGKPDRDIDVDVTEQAHVMKI
jgi:hypothetical protein